MKPLDYELAIVIEFSFLGNNWGILLIYEWKERRDSHKTRINRTTQITFVANVKNVTKMGLISLEGMQINNRHHWF